MAYLGQPYIPLSDRVLQRYTKGVFKQAAAEAYLKAIDKDDDSQ